MESLQSSSEEGAGGNVVMCQHLCGKGTLVSKESRSDYAKFHPPISYCGI